MTTIAIALGAFILYLIAYHTYGKWLGQKIFRLDAKAKVPSIELEDGNDYVPTDKGIVFGHHFTSIAGTGPIVGPALAVIWGWVPALLWVILGSILIGAVHDFGALVVSLRSKGQTVGDIAGRVITRRTRILFLTVLFLALTIVLAIFGLVIASVFKSYPQAIFPCLIQIPLAVIIGLTLHRKGASILVPSLISLAVMYLTVAFGNVGFLGDFNEYLGGDPSDPDSNGLPVIGWVVLLLIYSYVASVLPVWTLLQPRDYINSLQLLSALGLVVLGLATTSFFGGAAPTPGAERPTLEIVAPAFNVSPEGAPSIFPFLFITIACGAISGFHCLVSSGTSSKQLKCESDAQLVGYGSMLTEGFLAVLVILACISGLGLGTGSGESFLSGSAAFEARYASWDAAKGLGAKVGAFVEGSANFLKSLGLPAGFSIALMGVFVASFAATTLDTACRLQRYVVQELAGTLAPRHRVEGKRTGEYVDGNPLFWLTNRHAATLFAITIAFFIAQLPGGEGQKPGTGGLLLWPLFGAINQLLAGLAFLVITFWLRRRGLPYFLALIPGILMLILPAIAMSMNLRDFADNHSWLLFGFGFSTIIIEVWMIAEAISVWKKSKGILEPGTTLPQSSDEGGRSC
ncbi:carbon starvation protein A [bacterium]|nr:carbon starvation protein A [Akkermansiaceae bacterium]MDA8976495.1 carbon starvation protein A [bacterium]MDA7907732.1 carbon starvation protein A [Akkermansiaceae bacterium]MDA7934191.1 carbon starvation protein A [Akkermansiaceae bacterium]MDB4465403.1 carbon starvation protein A [Akkermansiaceae bacterium]